MPALLTILTDFGEADGYVAQMRGVVASLAPETRIHDAGQGLPRGDVAHAAWVLGRYWSRFPPGTVHLVVVDPGVGTERHALALEADGRFGVGPDNGVFTDVLRAAGTWRAVALATPESASSTFHGRDVFAPAAARLAAGDALEDLGDALPGDPLALDRGSAASVRAVDRFGNLVTDLSAEAVGAGERIRIAGEELEVRGTYGDVAPGELTALVGSDGTVEVAVREGSAAERLGVGAGAPVEVTPPATSDRRPRGRRRRGPSR